MSSCVTNPRYPSAPEGALRSMPWRPSVSCPQSPSGTRPDETGVPLTTRLVIALPFALPPAPEGPVPAEVRAVIASAVISPLKIERPVTTLSARAAATVVTDVVALAVMEPARTTEPSDGNEKLPAEGLLCGGEVTEGEAAELAFAGETLIAHAVADAPGFCAGPPASAEPNARSASGRSSTRRRTREGFCQRFPTPSSGRPVLHGAFP